MVEQISEVVGRELNCFCRWKLTNVPELDGAILFLMDYSPNDAQPPLSVALSYSGGNKCWLSESSLQKINNNVPRPYPNYQQFVFEGRTFYPFSVQLLPHGPFESSEVIKAACQRLYQHVVWSV